MRKAKHTGEPVEVSESSSAPLKPLIPSLIIKPDPATTAVYATVEMLLADGVDAFALLESLIYLRKREKVDPATHRTATDQRIEGDVAVTNGNGIS